ncbi:SPOR domain-containing protein [Niveibacterium terrae]|uniref:SPOR domain-containing protein n=1 Tax=Niveibacterium terrae TaxID=3373598 RepID=UPI003A8DFBB9
MKVLRALFYLLLLANLVLVFVSLGGFSRAPGGEPERLSSQLHPEQIRILAQSSPEDSSAEPAPAESASDSAPAQADVANDSGESAEAKKAEAKKAAEAQKSEEARKAEEAKKAAELKKEEEQKKLAENRKAEEAKKLAAAPACASWAGLSRAQADEIVQRARSAGLKSLLSNAGTPSAWWVHLPAQSDRAGAERKAAELRSLGVTDFFIVNDAGPNQNAISLGLYKNEDSAKRMLEQLKASGVQTARISTREASQIKVEVSGAGNSLSAFTSQSRFPGTHTSCTPAKR